jgi:hypothetical protein
LSFPHLTRPNIEPLQRLDGHGCALLPLRANFNFGGLTKVAHNPLSDASLATAMSFLKSLFGLGDGSQKLADRAHELYPDPNANEAAYQKDALADLHKGIVPTGLTATGYLCKKGEKVIYCFNNVTHYCSAVHSEWAGRSAGTSVRIAKGFWIRTGANRGHSVQHTSMVEQGGGCLILTNQGLSFVSQQKSARILLSHILSFQPGSGTGADDFEFYLETDHARNNSHRFFGINPINVNFIKCVLELLANGPSPVGPSSPPSPQSIAPPPPPASSPPQPSAPPVVLEEIPDDVPHLKFTHTHGIKK